MSFQQFLLNERRSYIKDNGEQKRGMNKKNETERTEVKGNEQNMTKNEQKLK